MKSEQPEQEKGGLSHAGKVVRCDLCGSMIRSLCNQSLLVIEGTQLSNQVDQLIKA